MMTMMTNMTTMTNLRTYVMLKYCPETNVCYKEDSFATKLKCMQEDSAVILGPQLELSVCNDDINDGQEIDHGDDPVDDPGSWGEMDCGDDLGDWGEIDHRDDEVLNKSYDQYLKTVEQGPVCVDDNTISVDKIRKENGNIEDSAISVDKIRKENDDDDHEDSKDNDDDEHEDSKDNDDDEHEDSLDDNDFRTRQWTVELVIRRGVINKKLRQYIYKTMKQKNKQPAQYIMSTSWATVRCAPRVENSV